VRKKVPTAPSKLRSRIMRAVKGKDTSPEMLVRRVLRSLGFRFALHSAALPGKPDVVLKARKTAIFVNGCFWHGHDCARGARVPKTNRAYWTAKIGRNVARDRASLRALRKLGWRPVVVWECTLKDEARLRRRLQRLLAARSGRR
jgi:DNA mismatch endonuclease, patch repair protein